LTAAANDSGKRIDEISERIWWDFPLTSIGESTRMTGIRSSVPETGAADNVNTASHPVPDAVAGEPGEQNAGVVAVMSKPIITRALIPCGGKGTRMLALTGGAPKELIEIGGIPVAVRVLQECATSGITEVLVVIAPDKEEIEKVLSAEAGKPGMPEKISFIVQEEARGLADAIRLGRDFARGEPMVVALPDNLFAGADPGVKQVIDTFYDTGLNVVAVVEIFASDAANRGPTSVYPGTIVGDEFRISRIPDKGERGKTFDTGGAASAFTGVGRLVFASDAFDAIDRVEATLAPGAELDDVPVMQLLLSNGRLVGRRISGKFFDVGLVAGYREASAAFSSGA
jgi:UTP--glucose-1-phosphate uridylyltransferase